MRPQDKWNLANGYVSKSYKVNQELAQRFTQACEASKITQSGALSSFMQSFCLNTERRRKCMHFKAAYDSVSTECINALDTKVNRVIESISEAEIQQKEKYLLSDARTGKKISNPIIEEKAIRIKGDLSQYLLTDASDIVDYLKQIVISEIALYRLVIDGKAMPIVWRNPQPMEINIVHNHGNSIIHVFLDLMPFESYMVILPTQT